MTKTINHTDGALSPTPPKIFKIALLGKALSLLGGCMLLYFFAKYGHGLFLESEKFAERLTFLRSALPEIPEFKDNVLAYKTFADQNLEYSIVSKILIWTTIKLDLIWGMVILAHTWQLFSSYGKGYVFSIQSANQLKNIGWSLLLLIPIITISDFYYIKGVLFHHHFAHTFIQYDLSDIHIIRYIGINPGDIYGIIFGVLITLISHIMKEALIISEENKSFI